MTTAATTENTPALSELRLRSAVYALLSHSVCYPKRERLAGLRGEVRPLLAAVESEDAALSNALTSTRRARLATRPRRRRPCRI